MSDKPTTYAAFWLYKMTAGWSGLSASERSDAATQYNEALQNTLGDLTLRGAYSFAGLRPDVDFGFWIHGTSLDALHSLAIVLRKTELGKYASPVQAYVGMSPESRYAPEHRPAFVKGEPPRNFLSMYPFTKTPSWFLLPFEERRTLMAEHGRMGQKHSAMPEVRIHTESDSAVAVADPPMALTGQGDVLSNTVHAFGLGDFEFIVAFESDDPSAIERMVEDLRSAKVREYTQSDTPIYLGRRKPVAELLSEL